MNILTLSGFIPEQICDTKRFIKYNGTDKPNYYCGYVADYISQIKEDESIDGAVFPKTCDSSRTILSYCGDSNKFLYQMHIPNGIDEDAISYYAKVIEDYKYNIEKYYQTEISIDLIKERSNKIQERNARIKRLYDKLENISYKEYLEQIHNILQKPLNEQTIEEVSEKRLSIGKPVYLVGSFLSNTHLIDIIENSGMKIVGDNITESKRLFSINQEEMISKSIYYEISKAILYNRFSPSQNRFRELIDSDLGEIDQKGIKAVIFITQKYCEPYQYLMSVYKKELEKKGIQVLELSNDGTFDNQKLEFAIETFGDMI